MADAFAADHIVTGPDPRFFRRLGPLRLSDLAQRVGGNVRGPDDPDIAYPSKLDGGATGTLAFAKSDRLIEDAGGYAGTALIIADGMEWSGPAIAVRDPRSAFAYAVDALIATDLTGDEHAPAQIHPTARIAPSAVVMPGAIIGARTHVLPNAVVGVGVVIGDECLISAGAVLQCAYLGNGVHIGPNAVIGEMGFGIVGGDKGAKALPHIGRALLHDGVSIGALSAVDRGMLGDTVLEQQVHLDNFCHIGHNSRIGAHSVFAAQAGISGSVTVGMGVTAGGRVGIADHVIIGDRARLGADAAIMRDIPAGETWLGAPAKPHREFLREVAVVSRLARDRRKPKS